VFTVPFDTLAGPVTFQISVCRLPYSCFFYSQIALAPLICFIYIWERYCTSSAKWETRGTAEEQRPGYVAHSDQCLICVKLSNPSPCWAQA
jgi:hypothetical protein